MPTTLPSEEAVRTHQAIARLNLNWLLLCREVAAHSIAEATLRFGVEPQVAEHLLTLSVDALTEVADNDQMVFKPLIDLTKGRSSLGSGEAGRTQP